MGMKALAPLPLACVVWDDAHGHAGGEYTAEEIVRDMHDPAVITSFGLLVHQDERGVTIAQEITSGDGAAEPTYRGLGFVPAGMLREVIVLGVPSRPRVRKPKAT